MARLEHEWAAELGAQIGAEMAVEPSEVLDRVKARRMDRSGQFARSRRRRRGRTPASPSEDVDPDP